MHLSIAFERGTTVGERHGAGAVVKFLGRVDVFAEQRIVRVVDQKTAVVPLLADPDKLLASLRSLLALAPSPSGRGPG